MLRFLREDGAGFQVVSECSCYNGCDVDAFVAGALCMLVGSIFYKFDHNPAAASASAFWRRAVNKAVLPHERASTWEMSQMSVRTRGVAWWRFQSLALDVYFMCM